MPALLAVCYSLLLTAVLLGTTIPGTGLLPGMASPAEIGLGANRVGIEPLTDRFVDRALGPGAPLSNSTPDRAGPERRAASGSGEGPGNVDVDHPFTNDDQADAYAVRGLPFTGRTSTADADREAGEPECGTQLGGTVWYRYTATRGEALLADTFGTAYQTSLAAYRQSASGPVALENACDFDPQGNSQIKFDVQPGTTYLLQIGAAVRGGSLIFHLARLSDKTILASVSTKGKPGNGPSKESSISFDGRYVAFASIATNLIGGSHAGAFTNSCIACLNVFLRDRQTGTTSLVSEALDGRGANDDAAHPQVSDDGRYVVFGSPASNLVAGDTNDSDYPGYGNDGSNGGWDRANTGWDVFVRDMRTGHTERASLSEHGDEIHPTLDNSLLWFLGGVSPSMSGDGRYVAFTSGSPDVVESDDDAAYDVFVRDRREGTTRLVSLDDAGQSPLGDVFLLSMSRNGRWVVLLTYESMSGQDRDLSLDVFVRDLWTGTTELVSVPEAGHELDGMTSGAWSAYNHTQRSISDDGRYVVFGTDGAFVDGDTNGIVDVFVRDRLRKTTERVSLSSSGGQGELSLGPITNGDLDWSISGDGRVVAFSTYLNSLEPGDANDEIDVYLHDRVRKVTLRVSASGDAAGGYGPAISGDGMHTTFYGNYPLSYRDTNSFEDVFVFSPIPAARPAGRDPLCDSRKGGCVPVAVHGSVPTPRCAASSEYENVGVTGAHEDVTPAPFPGIENFLDQDDRLYNERSVVRFKYRIDVSHTNSSPFARTADVRIALSWHSDHYDYDLVPNEDRDNYYDDYDLYVYDANGELLAYSFNPNSGINFNENAGTTGPREEVLVEQVPHCFDLRVEIVNATGRPVKSMTLDTSLEGFA